MGPGLYNLLQSSVPIQLPQTDLDTLPDQDEQFGGILDHGLSHDTHLGPELEALLIFPLVEPSLGLSLQLSYLPTYLGQQAPKDYVKK